ncbi:hypothetical protein KV203_01760 [Skermania piniformis]|uniref:Uncharacterized protein n=1 Tax=Skermania pinensis TaxID=39122 RepID=A0ABX8SFZ9_9ACTN|nr:hypothetical protein KV203_01760 [Skermania piniformis]
MLFPVLLMLFALAMERVEHRLSRLTVREQDVDDLLSGRSTEITPLSNTGRTEIRARFEVREADADPALAS